VKRIETEIPGVCLIEPDVFEDQRGFFFESYNRRRFEELGILDSFVQDNHSKSVKGTLRGLHYQLRHPQAKLCRVVQGQVLDVVVDTRVGSPTFGRYECAILSTENRRQIYVPVGFAHGFLVMSETAEFLYKCSDFHDREDEHGIAWDDPSIGIAWGIEAPILSPRDRNHPRLSAIDPRFLPRYAES
jgi:dTDP-4-dehydrorhamnose 3,5-epimerase